MTPSLLRTIIAATRRAVEARAAAAPLAALRAHDAPAPRPHAFRSALASAAAQPRIIAECKRRSPSRGILREAYDPAGIARGYARAGAAAISVLTEPSFFDGALTHLADVRRAVALPLLRKDFIISTYQIAEARVAGADAVLLIAAALPQAALVELLGAAAGYGLDAVVETHDAAEIGRALEAGADIIGVNSRSLHTLAVDTGLLLALRPAIPAGVVAIAESGIRDAATIADLRAAGYHAFLVGERLMAAPDPEAALRDMLHGHEAPA